MKAEAEKFAEADKAKKELIESKNKASSIVFEMEKQLKEYGDKLESADREKIEEDLKKLKEMADKEDVSKEDLDKAIEATMASASKIGEAMQKAQAAKAQTDAKAGTNSGEDQKDGEKNAESDKKDAEEGEVVKE
jgi:molecular chaperone DnaK